MSGGKLVQHCIGHARHDLHYIKANEDVNCENIIGKILPITSTHHQMQYPFNLNAHEYQILFHSESVLSKGYHINDTQVLDKIPFEPEVVYYPKTKSLAIQGHPEIMPKNSETIEVFNKMLRYYLYENNVG